LAEKKRAGRNRTMCLDETERKRYLKNCIPGETMKKEKPLLDVMVHGDCFRVLPQIPDKCVDLLIVDPPYNLDKLFGTSKFRKMDRLDYQEFTRGWIEAALHTLKDTASLYVCCDWKTSVALGMVMEEYFVLQNRITWQREKGRGALKNWKNSMEDIWFATVSSDYTFHVNAVKQRRKVVAPYRVDGRPKDWQETKEGNYRDTHPSNFWDDISIPYWSMPENTDHPTQKPEKLYAKLVLASSDPGAVVLDPFAGVGTACVVAKKLGRRYIGIEQESEYCALAEKRLELAAENGSIQGYADGVFWERNSLPEQRKVKKPGQE